MVPILLLGYLESWRLLKMTDISRLQAKLHFMIQITNKRWQLRMNILSKYNEHNRLSNPDHVSRSGARRFNDWKAQPYYCQFIFTICALLVHLTHLLHYRPITFYGNHEPYKKSKATLRSPWELFTDNIFSGKNTHTYYYTKVK